MASTHSGSKSSALALNPQQLEAIQYIDGPLLVSAGPGTGKTQLLSQRVAHILRETDTDPQQILCLTFTNNAAINMRNRLGRSIGQAAQKVVIETFHAFAGSIMSQFPDKFWDGADVSIAEDTEQLGIIRDVLQRLPASHPLALKSGGKSKAIKKVHESLQLLSDAGMTPQTLTQALEANYSYIQQLETQLDGVIPARLSASVLTKLVGDVGALTDQQVDDTTGIVQPLNAVLYNQLVTAVAADEQTNKTTQTGEWKKNWFKYTDGQWQMHKERASIDFWRAITEFYDLYRAELISRGFYDYSDMIIGVTKVLKSDDELLEQVQEKFLYVMIDEFQDTNKAQMALINLVVSHPAHEGKPNLMVVGDDDQAIYAFNGADLSNMLDFTTIYPTTKVITLTQNYRSSQAILDTSKRIIELASERLVTRIPGISKQLVAARSGGTSDIKRVSLPTKEHQLYALVHDVAYYQQQNPRATIAVLANRRSDMEQVSTQLAAQGVAVRYEHQADVFRSHVVQLLLLLTETVIAIGEGDNSITNTLIHRLLRHPAWGLDAMELWQLAIRQRDKSDWLSALASSQASKMQTMSEWLLWLAGESSYQPLSVMLEYMIGLRPSLHLTSPLREYYLAYKPLQHAGSSSTRTLIDSEYLRGLSAIKILITLCGAIAKQRDATLYDLLHRYHLHQELERPLSDSSWFITADTAVDIMTIHKAKGLEFDAIFIYNATTPDWKPLSDRIPSPSNLPLRPHQTHPDEFVRMFYVAATRAKKGLYVYEYQTNTAGEPIPNFILTAGIPATTIDPHDIPVSASVLEQSIYWPALPLADLRTQLAPVLATYSLSPSALTTFLDITRGGPQLFLEQKLLGLPSAQNAHMAHGNAMHRALQFAQNNHATATLPDIIDEFKRCLSSQRITENELQQYLHSGPQDLTRLFTTYGFTLPDNGIAEVGLFDVRFNKATLGGKIDHLYSSDTAMLITDYKTGHSITSFTTKDKNKVVKAWNNKTQLLFYILLCQKSGRYKNITAYNAQLVNIEAETAKKVYVPLAYDSQDLMRLEQLIQAVWNKIQTVDMPDTSVYIQDIAGIQQFEQDLIDGAI